MNTIVVSAKSKNCGKSTLISKIIENLKGNIGVLKSSIHQSVEKRIVQEEKKELGIDHIQSNEKNNSRKLNDTERFLQKRADKVIYLHTDNDHLSEDIKEAHNQLKTSDHLLIEGNSIVDYINTDLLIYLNKASVKAKSSSKKVENKADIIIDSNSLLTDDLIEFEFNQQSISCFQTHLLSKALEIDLDYIGEKLEQEGISVKHCQLGLF